MALLRAKCNVRAMAANGAASTTRAGGKPRDQLEPKGTALVSSQKLMGAKGRFGARCT